jgi:PAS domain S-box-containing protein
MTFKVPISKKIIVTALAFGTATMITQEMGFKIPVLGSAHTDPRELLILIGAALTGPVGGVIIGLMSIPWFTGDNGPYLPTLVAHVLAGLFIGITYKKLVYQKMEFPWLLFGWVGLVILHYHLILTPVYLVVFFTLEPVAFALNFGDATLWHLYTTLVKLSIPELIATVVTTTIIIAALPPKYRCPLWCDYHSSRITVKNNSLAVRLTIWFVLLSALLFATVSIFVLHSVESGFDQATIEDQKEQTDLLATALSHSTEPQVISFFHDHYLTQKDSFTIVDQGGRYLFHPDHSKIGTLINKDFDLKSVELILSGKTNAFLDDQKRRVVGYATIKGQKKIVVTNSDNVGANEIVAAIYHSSQIKLIVSFAFISIVSAVAIWLVVGRPIRQLTRFAQQVGKGNLDIKLNPEDSVDELQVLSVTFNEMTVQLKSLINGLQEKVTELEATEANLSYSENQYRSLNDNIPVGVFRSTLDGELVSINSALFQMMDVDENNSAPPLSTKSFYENLEDRTALLATLARNKEIKGFECQMKRSDGSNFLASISARLVEEDDGRLKYIDGIIEDVTEREKAEHDLKKSETMLRALSIKLQEVEEANRKEIARELHDRVGQSLTALNINLNILHNQLQPEQLDKVKDRLMDSIELVEETTVNIRDVMAELRPQVLDDYGLAASLRWCREQFYKRTGIHIDLETATIEETRFPENVETALFRIIQEAFNNVIKHARASTISVTAAITAEFLAVTIIDNGQGFEVSTNNSSQDLQHWGLVNMRERAEALGGQFQIESELGKGTRLQVKIPIHMEERDDQGFSG